MKTLLLFKFKFVNLIYITDKKNINCRVFKDLSRLTLHLTELKKITSNPHVRKVGFILNLAPLELWQLSCTEIKSNITIASSYVPYHHSAAPIPH